VILLHSFEILSRLEFLASRQGLQFAANLARRFLLQCELSITNSDLGLSSLERPHIIGKGKEGVAEN
jgi:hypothetical protein